MLCFDNFDHNARRTEAKGGSSFQNWNGMGWGITKVDNVNFADLARDCLNLPLIPNAVFDEHSDAFVDALLYLDRVDREI